MDKKLDYDKKIEEFVKRIESFKKEDKRGLILIFEIETKKQKPKGEEKRTLEMLKKNLSVEESVAILEIAKIREIKEAGIIE